MKNLTMVLVVASAAFASYLFVKAAPTTPTTPPATRAAAIPPAPHAPQTIEEKYRQDYEKEVQALEQKQEASPASALEQGRAAAREVDISYAWFNSTTHMGSLKLEDDWRHAFLQAQVMSGGPTPMLTEEQQQNLMWHQAHGQATYVLSQQQYQQQVAGVVAWSQAQQNIDESAQSIYDMHRQNDEMDAQHDLRQAQEAAAEAAQMAEDAQADAANHIGDE